MHWQEWDLRDAASRFWVPDPPGRRFEATACVIVAVLWIIAWPSAESSWAATPLPQMRFERVSQLAGLLAQHSYADPFAGTMVRNVAGGMAVGDFDNDGWIDVYVECGDAQPNALYRNLGDGHFVDVADQAGVSLASHLGSGPLFIDFDGDRWLDLFVGGIEGQRSFLFRNLGNGSFEDVTVGSGLDEFRNVVSASSADFDGDGRLDLFVSHWGSMTPEGYLWHNEGDGRFRCVDAEAGLTWLGDEMDFSFTCNFADIDDDRDPDLLLTVDFGKTKALRNLGGGQFVEVAHPPFDDENGMGAAVGDYDNDGDLDWFVSSIFDGDGIAEGNWGTTGNRMYRNLGDGEFEDATEEAGVRNGDWGWASSFADFDNDGDLDLVQVNGWPRGSDQFHADHTRLFLSDGRGGFQESSQALGVVDTAQGRGVSCFDYDRDGDLDILVVNNGSQVSLWRNELSSGAHSLTIRPVGEMASRLGVGARVYLSADGHTQMRELRCGSNYVSQNPMEAHFGLDSATRAESVFVFWADGSVSSYFDVDANQVFEVDPSRAQRQATRLSPISAQPNPFRIQTSFVVDIDLAGDGPLRVLNLAGRTVRTLRPAYRQGHSSVFLFDGRASDGSSLSSGVYLVTNSRFSHAPSTRVLLLK